MAQQQRLPPPAMAPRPTLPDQFAGNREASHTRHRVQQRNLCSVCVYLLYHSGESWAPNHAAFLRQLKSATRTSTALHDVALLCGQHHLEWKERDDEARKRWQDRQA